MTKNYPPITAHFLDDIIVEIASNGGLEEAYLPVPPLLGRGN